MKAEMEVHTQYSKKEINDSLFSHRKEDGNNKKGNENNNNNSSNNNNNNNNNSNSEKNKGEKNPHVPQWPPPEKIHKVSQNHHHKCRDLIPLKHHPKHRFKMEDRPKGDKQRACHNKEWLCPRECRFRKMRSHKPCKECHNRQGCNKGCHKEELQEGQCHHHRGHKESHKRFCDREWQFRNQD